MSLFRRPVARLLGEGGGQGLLAIIGFSLTLPFTRVAVPYFGALGVTCARALVAGAGAMLYLGIRRASLPTPRQLRELVVVALGTVIGFPLLAAVAMTRVPSSHGAVVTATVPLFTSVIGARLSRERLPPAFWLASGAGTLAVALFALLALLRGGEVSVALTDGLLIVACVSASTGYAFGGRLARELGGGCVISWALVLCLPIMLPATVVLFRRGLPPAPVTVWGGFLYLALVSQLGAFFLWNHALARGGIARVSQIQLFQPFFTILVSAWFIGEKVPPDLVLFAALVVLSIAAGRRAAAASPSTPRVASIENPGAT